MNDYIDSKFFNISQIYKTNDWVELKRFPSKIIFYWCLVMKLTLIMMYFFLITRDVRANLHAPRLIPGPTEYPASLVGR